MKKILTVCFLMGLSLLLFAGTEVSVIGASSKNGSKNFVKEPDVKVVLTNDTYFYAERYLGEKGSNYLFVKDGKKVMLPKSMVKEVKLKIAVQGDGEKSNNKKQQVNKQTEKKGKKKRLILTDYNVQKNYYGKENSIVNQENEEKQQSGLRVKVENQVIERKKDTITFKADIKNVTGLEVGKLSIILNIYDSKGKLVEKKKVFLANRLKDGKSVPFTYSLKDPEGKITRFDYSFEGIVYKPVEKEE